MAMVLEQDDGKITENIFSKAVHITVKSTDLVERNCVLFLSAQLQSTPTSLFRKEFVLRLTDETDPLFFYHLRLRDEDYQSLRINQGLEDDFAAFPGKFVQQLNSCSKENSKDSPMFALQLRLQSGSGVLSFCERKPTNFKTFVEHLVLKLTQGSDAEVKRYLADTVKQLTLRSGQLYESLKHTEADFSKRLQEALESLQSSSRENERLRNELKDQNSQLLEQYGYKLNMEKDKTIQLQSELQRKSERERQKIEHEYNKKVTALENKITNLECRIQDLQDNKSKNESTVIDLRTRIECKERALQTMQHETERLRKQNVKIEGHESELEKINGNLTLQLTNLKRDIESNKNVILESQNSLKAAQQKLICLEMKNKNMRAVVKQRGQKLKTQLEELEKAKNHINYCEEQLEEFSANNKARSKIARAQEDVIKKKEKEAETLLNEKMLLQDKVQNFEKEILQLKDSLKELEAKIEKQAKELTSKEFMVSHLNGKLNDLEMSAARKCDGFQSSSSLTSSTPNPKHSFSDKREKLKLALSSVDEENDNDGFQTNLTRKTNDKENKFSISKSTKSVAPMSTTRGLNGLSNICKKFSHSENIQLPNSILTTNNAPSKFPFDYRSYFNS